MTTQTTNKPPLAIAIVSGGMDSTTLLYDMRQEFDVRVVSFDYGQRHRKELNSASIICHRLGVDHRIIDLRSMASLLSGSALTSSEIDVPEGHYTHESMKATVVPNRNAIMLACAWGYAVSCRATRVGIAVHAGDHAIYPDCRRDFITTLEAALRSGTEGFRDQWLQLYTPYIDRTKAEICALGDALNVPFDLTWSCYKGGEKHCGKCGTCFERIEAFETAQVPDPTEYEDAV